MTRVGIGWVGMLLLAVNCSAVQAAIIGLEKNAASYSQAFDGLPVSGSVAWSNDATLPGWYANATGIWDGTLTAGTGSSTAGDIYSFGLAGAVDRALGSLSSTSIGDPYYGVRFVNLGSTSITDLDISYVGEQWRKSGNTAAQSLYFEYRIGGTTFDNLGWTPGPLSLDFSSPIHVAGGAALNGNLAANRSALFGSLHGLDVTPGTEFWLRWRDPNELGNDHALAIDEFSLAATFAADAPPVAPVPEPASMTVWLLLAAGTATVRARHGAAKREAGRGIFRALRWMPDWSLFQQRK